ncbi:hypothetical protein DCS_04230 [Drechmeria coniospora]|uniref:Uncharacterized protein n=1 Tax=Drechmeria coniospora TaxID=98403 RepID=A0A151GJC1_DRECN|nr:hypothetical protein DCS_04230 [Drechmeria coniospora]KYK57223.1 hypothetical protein DCS_04230 [Drechmeria coniospora]
MRLFSCSERTLTLTLGVPDDCFLFPSWLSVDSESHRKPPRITSRAGAQVQKYAYVSTASADRVRGFCDSAPQPPPGRMHVAVVTSHLPMTCVSRNEAEHSDGREYDGQGRGRKGKAGDESVGRSRKESERVRGGEGGGGGGGGGGRAQACHEPSPS